LHLVMVAQYAVVLTLHHLADVFRQSLFQGLVVAALGDIFAALALVQNGLIVLAGDGRLEIYPAAMQVASHAGAVLGVPTPTDSNGLQFLGALGAVADALVEQRSQLGTGNVLGADTKVLFTILAGFDQIIDGGIHFGGN